MIKNKKKFVSIILFYLFTNLFGLREVYPFFRPARELENDAEWAAIVDRLALEAAIYDDVSQEEINLNLNIQMVLPEYGIGNFNLTLNDIRALYQLNTHNNAGTIIRRLENYKRGAELNLSALNIDSNMLILLIPYINNLVRFLGLRRLNLSGNSITFLPRTFGNLNGLFTLNFSDNNISYFHKSFNIIGANDTLDCLQKITSLRILNLSQNLLSYLPWQLYKLSNLRLLDLSSNNNLRILPNSFFNLFNLNYLAIDNSFINRDYLDLMQHNIPNLNIYY